MKDNNYVPFVSEVEEFNQAFSKPNNYTPTIPNDEKLLNFVVDFIKEETEELSYAIQERNIVEVLDAICDLLYGTPQNRAPAPAEVTTQRRPPTCARDGTHHGTPNMPGTISGLPYNG